MSKLSTLGACAAIPALLLQTGSTFAEELSYDYIEGAYVSTTIDGNGFGDIDGDGFAFGGSARIADNYHLFGSFQSLDYDSNLDFSALEIGAGYMVPVGTGTDLVARLSYINGEVDTPFGDADDSGFGIAVGFRQIFLPQLQGAAFVRHVDLDESGGDTSLKLEGEYFFNPEFSAGLSLEFSDDATSWGLGARLYFGK
ncbi:MAG: hypothetical protein WBN23_03700 [Woeseia sp.]